jgi:alginate O-acetyltransferase complex protein AlgI
LIFVLVEWYSRTKEEPLSGKFSWIKVTLALIALLTLGVYSDYKEFIYFQF